MKDFCKTVSLGKVVIIIVYGSVLLLISACGANTHSPASESSVSINSGSLVGFDNDHNTYAWQGIPYAQAPVGELRWRAPRPNTQWIGTLQALAHGPACIQPPNPTAGDNAPEHGSVVGAEDCLTLNVYAPKSAIQSDSKLPVMFWIHGGANIVGSAQQYNGALLAGTHNVVVVTINYRLGLLGWLRHSALREVGASPEDHSGNFGTLDIVAALHWVQDNIAAFGGNPDKVTVFGESAGGRNTWSMVQTPLAKGLFHGAIVQSGSLKIMDAEKSESIDSDAPDYPSYQNNGSEIVGKLVPAFASLGATELAARLRQKTPDEIYSQVTQHPQGMYEQPRLFLDGHVFTEPALSLFNDPAKYNAVPIITGSNRDEDKLFMAFDDQWVNFRLGFLAKVKDKDRYNKAAAFGADTWRYYSVDKPAEVISENGGPSVYTYRFDFDDLSDELIDLPVLMGAAHAMEIPFVFGSHATMPWRFLFRNKEQRSDLSAAMMSYWAEFAYSGDPASGRDGQLPVWQAHGERIMLFDTDNDGGVRMVREPVNIDDIKQRLINDEAFSRKERCEAYPKLWLNGYMVTDAYDSAEHAALCDL